MFLSLMIVFISANNADPDEMPPYAAFHLGLHYLPKNLFTDISDLIWPFLRPYMGVITNPKMDFIFPIFYKIFSKM